MTAFLTDSFTGSAGVSITSHTGEVGAAWVTHPINASGAAVLSNANRLRSNVAGAQGNAFYSSGVPRNANYFVEGVLRVVSLPASGYAGVTGRMLSAANNFYFAIYNLEAAGWQLWGNGVQLGMTFAQTLTVGSDYTVRLDMSGPKITLMVDGVARISVNDSVSTNVGKAGFITLGPFTDSTGIHVDSIVADHAWTKNIVCDGDSITVGAGTSSGAEYPAILGQSLGSTYSVTNIGVSGQTLTAMESDASSQIDPLYDASYAANILVCFGGTNDIYFNASADTTESRVQTYCANRRAIGWRVIVCTALPRGDFPGTSTLPANQQENYSVRRKAFNTWLRTNYTTFADELVDLAANYDLADQYDVGFFQPDRVHPSASGHVVIAGMVKDAIIKITTPPISGTVKDASGAFAARTVRAYRRSDGALAGSATSNGTTGEFSIAALDGTAHFTTAFDSGAENALIFDNITPV